MSDTNLMTKAANTLADRKAALEEVRNTATQLQCQAEPQVNYDPDFDVEDHAQNSSGDENDYMNNRYLGSFTKLLKHNHEGLLYTNGDDAVTAGLEVDNVAEFEKLRDAMQFDPDPNSRGTNGDLSGVARATYVDKDGETKTVERVWVNPQSAFSYSLKGGDISFFQMTPAMKLNSKQNAAEMMEVYLQTLCRDVDFNDYGTGLRTDKVKFPNGDYDSITNFACRVLKEFGDDYKGAKENGEVTYKSLFRGIAMTDGGESSDLIGEYVSQFLLQPLYPLFPAGCAPFVGGLIGVANLNQEVLARPQHYPIPGEREFGVSFEEYVKIQNGRIPRLYEPKDYNQDYARHLRNGRDMGSLVHTDGPYEAYYNALNILIYNDFPRSRAFPYSRFATNSPIQKEGDGHTMGPSDVYALIAQVCLEAFKAAWAQKWRLHRKLRPEAMGRLVHLHKTVRPLPTRFLHPSLHTGENAELVLEMIRQRNIAQAECCSMLDATAADTYLLAQMYPEASPAHPAYPSGHATVAGACTTVIKAIFDDTQNFAAHLDRNNREGEATKVARQHPHSETRLVSIEGEKDADGNIVNNLPDSEEVKMKMTVGSELDKLASNIALGRNFGGVHYRQDGDEGILLGENVAIRYLQDHIRAYTENGVTGYTLTRRNGERIEITADSIRPATPNT